MSQQGERHGTQHDWWRELYEAGSDDAGPAPGGESLDDHIASAFRAAGAAPPARTAREPSAGPAPDGRPPLATAVPPGTAARPPATAARPPDTPSLTGAAPDDAPSPAGAAPDDAPPPPAADPPDDAPGSCDALPVRDVPAPRTSGEQRMAEERTACRSETGDRGPGTPASGSADGRVSVAAPVRVGYVGDRPPTYEPEPTALPLADPARLADLVPDTVLDGARLGPLTLRVASLRGDSARFRGEPRRDALLTARFGTGDSALVLVAVATGPRGVAGAHRAAHEVCGWIGGAVGRSQARLAEDIRKGRRAALKSGLHRLTARGLGRLRARAGELDLDPDAYTASLRCLLLPADPDCRTRVFFGSGDGGLFRLRGGAWEDLEPPSREPARPRGTWEPRKPQPSGERAYPADGAVREAGRAGGDRPDGGGPASGAPDADRDRHPDSDPGPHSGPGRPPGTGQPSGDRHPGADRGPLTGRPAAGARVADGRPGGIPADGDPVAGGPADPDSFRFRASVARPGDTLLLCSPGLADPLRGEPALARALGERWGGAEPPGLAGFLADTQTRVKGYADDRTAAAVWEA